MRFTLFEPTALSPHHLTHLAREAEACGFDNFALAVVLDVDANALLDMAGNNNAIDDNNSVAETVDTTLPTIVDATLFDMDKNGNIDEILIEFSEPMNDSSIATGDVPVTINISMINPTARAARPSTVTSFAPPLCVMRRRR